MSSAVSAVKQRHRIWALLRLILALMYTIFSRYDINGDDIDLSADNDLAYDTWEKLWKLGRIPSEPVERYFQKWHDHFFLIDDERPFYQSKTAEGKNVNIISVSKMIGTLSESDNKQRLFSDRKREGRLLSLAEAARWLVYLVLFDDVASKFLKDGRLVQSKPSWPSRLSLIALKGDNFFETIMLNYCADCDTSRNVFDEKPSWEQDNNISDFNRLIPVPDNQAALLSIMNRRILLCPDLERKVVEHYYLCGGDYFEDNELFDRENMALWTGYKDKDKKSEIIHYKPKKHESDKKIWQEFGSVVGISEDEKKYTKTPGVIKWFNQLLTKRIIKRSYMFRLIISTVFYNDNQATSRPVVDYTSDSLSFHAGLLEDVGKAWRERVISEIKKCNDAAYWVGRLYKDLQKSNGRKDRDSKTDLSGEKDSRAQFYDRIDRPFRLWLNDLTIDSDMDSYTADLEYEIRNIALRFGASLSEEIGRNSIFADDENSSAKALNIYYAEIYKIFNKAGEKYE